MGLGLKNKIGLPGGVGIVIGGVIGMGTFVLIPGIVAYAGPAAWLAVTIALTASIASVLPLIQLSSAMPVAGGGFEYGRRLINPYSGYLVSWLAVIGGSCTLSLISSALADQFRQYLPAALPPHLSAMAFVAVFYLFYLLGLRIVTAVQVLLCLQLLAALFLYFVPVLGSRGFVLHAGLPETPNFLLAVIFSFNISLGFQIIIELGEEMKRPEKNIPLSLLIGGAIVLLVYLCVTFAYSFAVGTEHMSERIKMISTAAPYWGAGGLAFIRLGMISSGLASFSGAAIALPRELFALSRAGALPAFFSEVDRRGNPSRAMALFFGLVLLVMAVGNILEYNGVIEFFFGPDIIDFYAYMAIFGIMAMTVVLSVAALRLPARMPGAYASAYLRFPPWLLYSLCIFSMLSSSFLMVVISLKKVVPLLYAAIWLMITLIYFLYGRKALAAENREKKETKNHEG